MERSLFLGISIERFAQCESTSHCVVRLTVQGPAKLGLGVAHFQCYQLGQFVGSRVPQTGGCCVARKRTVKGKRYTEAEKKNILASAAREKLTGAQVKKKFGISLLTFYRWRGPVRSRRKGRAAGAAGVRLSTGNEGIRDQVRRTIQGILPGIIRSEVDAYLDGLFSGRRPGRPRKG